VAPPQRRFGRIRRATPRHFGGFPRDGLPIKMGHSVANFRIIKVLLELSIEYPTCKNGGHALVPKTASANAANAKFRNRQIIGIGLLFYRLG